MMPGLSKNMGYRKVELGTLCQVKERQLCYVEYSTAIQTMLLGFPTRIEWQKKLHAYIRKSTS